NLPAAQELKIDLGQELRVDPRAVLGTQREIDVEPPAKLVQRIARAGEALLGERNRVDTALDRQQRLAGARQFRIEEFQIELGVVDNERRVRDEGKKI